MGEFLLEAVAFSAFWFVFTGGLAGAYMIAVAAARNVVRYLGGQPWRHVLMASAGLAAVFAFALVWFYPR